MYKSCTNRVQIVYKLCTNRVQIVYNSCTNCVQLCTNCVQIVYKSCTNCVQIVYKSCTNRVQIVYKLCTNRKNKLQKERRMSVYPLNKRTNFTSPLFTKLPHYPFLIVLKSLKELWILWRGIICVEHPHCCINHKVLKNVQSQPDHSYVKKLIKRRRIPKSVLVVIGDFLGICQHNSRDTPK